MRKFLIKVSLSWWADIYLTVEAPNQDEAIKQAALKYPDKQYKVVDFP